MSDLSTANSIDISSQIGALELDDDPASHRDDVLEAEGMAVGTTAVALATTSCCGTIGPRFCHGDGALEAAGLTMAGGTQTLQAACTVPGHCISDGALEAAVVNMIGAPTWPNGGCAPTIGCR